MRTLPYRSAALPSAALALAVLLAASCGSEGPDPRLADRAAEGSQAAPETQRRRGAGRADAEPQTRRRAAPWRPPRLTEVVTAEPEELGVLFEERIQAPSEAMQAHMRRFETDATYWPTETVAERAEAELERALMELIEGTGSGPGGVGEYSVDIALLQPEQVFPPRAEDDADAEPSSLTVERAYGAPPDADAGVRFPELLAKLRRELRAGSGQGVSVLVTAIDGLEGEGPLHTDALATLTRSNPAPRQVTLEFGARWSRDAEGALTLEHLELRDLELVKAPATLFEEITPSVLGEEPYYRSELLRGTDDYYTRTDRNGGTAFQGMQGIAVGDVNGDGLEDVYLCQQVGVASRLLVRQADGTAVDAAGPAKVRFLDVTRAALIVDLDGDGHRDLALAVGPTLVVAYNDGQGSFTEQIGMPSEGPEQIYNLSAADADGDGDLDLYAGRYALEGVMHGVPTPYHDASNGSTNTLWRNLFAERGERAFEDVTSESGLAVNNTRFTLASVWDDFDEDGDLDLYVVNDFGRNNLYRNDGEGRFEDVAESLGALDIGAGMGATVVDYDGDGDQDLYVTNMFSAPGLRITSQADRFMDGEHPDVLPWYAKHARGNSLLRNRGDGSFEDVTDSARVALARWAWGGVFGDLNNDGLEDLYVPCGHATRRGAERDLEAFFWHRVISSSPADTTPDENYSAAFAAVHRMVTYGGYSWSGNERNLVYLNTGGTRFADVSAVSGLDWPEDSRAAALMDWNDDGRLDVLLKNRNGPRLRILRNRTPESNEDAHWIAFELVGAGLNTDAVGARVEVRSGPAEAPVRTQRKRLHAGEGYLAQSSLRPHFGLGAMTSAQVEVQWPDGTVEAFGTLAADRRWRLVQGAAEAVEVALRPPATPLRPRTSAWNPDPVVRVPLAARLPMRPFELPGFDQPDRKVADLSGAPLLVVLYGSSEQGGLKGAEATIAALATRAAALNKAGVTVVPLATDTGPELGEARKLTETYGLAETAGYADGRVLETFEMIFLEVLGYFHDLPSPAALLIDPAGNLCVLYVGPPDPRDVVADLETMASFPGGASGTGRFGGGRWMVRRIRDLKTLAGIFTARGHVDIGRYYEDLSR